MEGGHVERGATLRVLDVGVSPCLNEELQTQGTMVREGGVMEGGLTLWRRGGYNTHKYDLHKIFNT